MWLCNLCWMWRLMCRICWKENNSSDMCYEVQRLNIWKLCLNISNFMDRFLSFSRSCLAPVVCTYCTFPMDLSTNHVLRHMASFTTPLMCFATCFANFLLLFVTSFTLFTSIVSLTPLVHKLPDHCFRGFSFQSGGCWLHNITQPAAAKVACHIVTREVLQIC